MTIPTHAWNAETNKTYCGLESSQISASSPEIADCSCSKCLTSVPRDTSLSDPVGMPESGPTAIELSRAMVMLETYGSTSYPPQTWERWRFAETNYAPKWLTAEDLDGAEPDECVTVLDYSLREPEAPEGWKLVYQYAAGEKDCPDCEGSGNAPADGADSSDVLFPNAAGETRRACPLCKGEGLLYEGEECQVCVFRPLVWISGSGMVGCLYDGGPDRHFSKDEAIETLLFRFDDLSERYQARMRRDLEARGYHQFDHRIRRFAGADYCEITGPQ